MSCGERACEEAEACVKRIWAYINQCGILRMEPSTRGLRDAYEGKP